MNFSRFFAATHGLKVNCVKMAGDRPRQAARMKFLAFNIDVSSQSRNSLGSRRHAHAGVKQGYPIIKSDIFTANGLFSTKLVADIGTDILLIITSNSDELLSSVNIDDFEPPT